jgi:hypothetical protein
MQPQKKIVKTEKDLSSANAMNKIKAFLSPGSVTGKLRDADKRREEQMKKAGA